MKYCTFWYLIGTLLYCETLGPQTPHVGNILCVVKLRCKEEKYTYKILIHNNEIPTCETKRNSEFSHIDWKSVYSLVFDISKETYIQWFQYRIIHKIIGTKSLLFKMNIATDNLCTFCNEEIENITHLFWICRYTQEIIRFAIHFINRNRQHLPIQLTCQDMILGITNSKQIDLNILCLEIKRYSFQCQRKK